MHMHNGIFHSILDTSSPQPDDKQDGAQSIHHIAFYMFAWVLGQSDLWLVNGLVLMLTPFLVVKATTYKHKKNEHVHFSYACACVYVAQFSLAYTRACACAYTFALVKSRFNAAKRLLSPAA